MSRTWRVRAAAGSVIIGVAFVAPDTWPFESQCAVMTASVVALVADRIQADPGEITKCNVDLKSKDPLTRYQAALRLHAMGRGAMPATAGLIDALGDTEAVFHWDGADGGGSESTSDIAARALEGVGEAAVLPLIEALSRHPNVTVRLGAAAVLGRIGDERAVEPLIEVLADQDLQTGAARSLAQFSVPGLSDTLFARLGGAKTAAQEGLLSALAKRKDPRVARILTERLKAPEWQVREVTVPRVADLGGPEAVGLLNDALHDSHPAVRQSAAAALGALGDSGGVPILIAALDDDDVRVRYLAVVSLGRLNDTRAVEPLKALVQRETDGNVRVSAEGVVRLLTRKGPGSVG